MYEYKYENCEMGSFFTTANHHQVIEKHTRDGWRLLQIVPTYYNSHGKPTAYEIIFERKIEE